MAAQQTKVAAFFLAQEASTTPGNGLHVNGGFLNKFQARSYPAEADRVAVVVLEHIPLDVANIALEIEVRSSTNQRVGERLRGTLDVDQWRSTWPALLPVYASDAVPLHMSFPEPGAYTVALKINGENVAFFEMHALLEDADAPRLTIT